MNVRGSFVLSNKKINNKVSGTFALINEHREGMKHNIYHKLLKHAIKNEGEFGNTQSIN